MDPDPQPYTTLMDHVRTRPSNNLNASIYFLKLFAVGLYIDTDRSREERREREERERERERERDKFR